MSFILWRQIEFLSLFRDRFYSVTFSSLLLFLFSLLKMRPVCATHIIKSFTDVCSNSLSYIPKWYTMCIFISWKIKIELFVSVLLPSILFPIPLNNDQRIQLHLFSFIRDWSYFHIVYKSGWPFVMFPHDIMLFLFMQFTIYSVIWPLRFFLLFYVRIKKQEKNITKSGERYRA